MPAAVTCVGVHVFALWDGGSFFNSRLYRELQRTNELVFQAVFVSLLRKIFVNPPSLC
jgi:hypothetical protein